MTVALDIAFAAPAFVAFALAGFFALEVAGAFAPPRALAWREPGPLAVIVPAHNEQGVIGETLADVKAQLRAGDRLLVVADNCDDSTASIAASAGAETLERTDPARRGKGYALQHALEALRDSPPAAVVFIDADCRLQPGALARVAGVADASSRPAQMLYLMRAPDEAGPRRRVAAFAWLLMNDVRMSGLFRLFDVCRLTGSGMALPWSVAGGLDLASGEIVEDLALSTRLAAVAPPVLVRDAVLISDFPVAEESAARQRARWEHGSLRLSMRRAPAMLLQGALKFDARLVAAGLDLAIPPLTVFVASLLALSVAGLVPLAWGTTAPLALSLSALALVAAGLFAAWTRFGRQALPASTLLAAIGYVADKRRVYAGDARRSTRRWTRTERDG